MLLDPNDPEVVRAAERDGIPRDWIDAAQRSPIHALINVFKVALPLHPEYRTMPMVWYIPPLSPVVDVIKDTGFDAEDQGNLFAAIEALRSGGRSLVPFEPPALNAVEEEVLAESELLDPERASWRWRPLSLPKLLPWSGD